MKVKAARFAALLTTALALTMTSAHVLELPQKLRYDAQLYALVNTSLYRYFALVGGAYTVASIVSACALVWVVRGRHPAFEWSIVGASFVVLAFVSWLVLVQPVNAEVTQRMGTAPFEVAALWQELRGRWEYGQVTGFVLELLGFAALVVSSVVETPAEAPHARVVHVRVSSLIHAPRERVAAIYTDFDAWPRVFDQTIKGARLLSEDGSVKTLEIDHVEGSVINVLSQLDPNEVLLEEWKKRYTASFLNVFEAVPDGTRYSVDADIRVSGPWTMLAFLVRPLARARIKRFMIEPLRRMAESPA